MKTKILALATVLSLFAVGCNKDDDNNNSTPIAASEMKANNEMDDVSDDVLYITESESDETASGKSSGGVQTFVGDCATINTEISGNTYVRTIDFGATNCTLFNGNQVRGKIILTFTNDFDAQTRTISYAFDGFYHNDRHVEGNRTVVRTIVDGHPHAVISMDLTVTTPAGAVYTRVGERVRDFYEGYLTPYVLFDNKFHVTGAWTTYISTSGNTYVTTIGSPLNIDWTCAYINEGTISVVRSNDGATATLDYGDGACDNNAVLTVNGVAYNIEL